MTRRWERRGSHAGSASFSGLELLAVPPQHTSVNVDEDTALPVDLGSLVSDAETSDANLSYAIVTPPGHGTRRARRLARRP